MDIKIESKLVQNALRLREVNRLAVKAVTEGNVEKLYELLFEFGNLKKEIKAASIEVPVAKIHDRGAQEVMQKISLEEPLPADDLIKALEGATGEELNLDGLDEDEIEEMGWDLFYSWYSHYEYIKSLYSIGSLILGISVPDNLVSFVSQARSCYAFQQYLAVYSLCRTILETSIRDICLRKKFIKEDKDNVCYIESYHVGDLINKVSRGILKEKIKEIYHKTSSLIHGRKTISKKEARETFKETLKIVQDLYTFHGF